MGPNLPVPPGIPTIDGAGSTLLPGLIDSHAHAWQREDLERAAQFGVTTEFDQKVSFQKSYIKTFNFRYRSRPWNQVLRHDGVWEAPQNTATGETKYATGSLQPLLQ